MRVIDADGHVEENLVTFSDKYFDPIFRSQRPQVASAGEDGLAYWMIDEQLFRAASAAAVTISGHP